MGEKQNQRVALTKRLLQESLLQLMKEKNIQNISVKELCEASGINRSTFYKHYVDKYALTESLCQDIFIPFEDYVVLIEHELNLLYFQFALVN